MLTVCTAGPISVYIRTVTTVLESCEATTLHEKTTAEVKIMTFIIIINHRHSAQFIVRLCMY